MALRFNKSSNPALSSEVFAKEAATGGETTMTVAGAVNKTAILLALIAGSATWVWTSYDFSTGALPMVSIAGAIVGLIFALITIFAKKQAFWTAPIYALAEGAFLGGISAYFDSIIPGIALQAVSLTFGTLMVMLLAYRTGLIKVTEKFKMGVVAATGGIFILYLITWIASFFGAGIPFIHEGGMIGIGFSLFVVVIAALNLVLDFDFIEKGAEHGAPSYMEWYGAFGLVVTLVWLYLEFLRLLAKIASSD